MPTIKVITFDLDNTLWDVQRVMIKAEQHLHSWLTAEVPEVVEHYSGEALRDLRTTVLAEHPNLVHDLSKLRRTVGDRHLSFDDQSGASAPDIRRARETFGQLNAEPWEVLKQIAQHTQAN